MRTLIGLFALLAAVIPAAHAAQAYGVRIYTIGAGTKGYVPFPVQDIWGRVQYQQVKTDVDVETLKKIADITGGKYYRATDTEALEQIYHQIDSLEKTKIETKGYREYKELFDVVLLAALMTLALEFLLANTWLARLP